MEKNFKLVIYITLLITLLSIWFQFLRPIGFFNNNKEQKIKDEKIVYIYAYNSKLDFAENNNITCEEQYVLPLERTLLTDNSIPYSPIELVEKSIQLLITEKLSEDEIETGFTTEYPHPEFELVSVKQENNTLFLEFTEVPGFTTGGSCRTAILQQQISKTAQQFFDEKIEIILLPEETLFAP